MPNQKTQLPWTEPDWFEQASHWIHSTLERQGIKVSGPIEQPHARPWSTVLRVPTDRGDIYFKATAPTLAHEPALTQALARWRPDCMLEVLATDLERGWMLMSDAGVMLRNLIQSPQDLHHWQRVLLLYAEVQIELADRLGEMLALGALDRRLAVLPAKYARLLDDVQALHLDLPVGQQRLREAVPRVTAMCEQLAGYDIPETLHHEDFHDANVFVREGRTIFSDWGDSGVGHPFCTLLVTLRVIAYRLELAEDDQQLTRVRDAYLEPWTRFESRQNLLAAFALAYRLGMVCRALTWHRVVSRLEEPLRAEYADTVPGWLETFVESEGGTRGKGEEGEREIGSME